MTTNERILVALVAGTVLVLLEPELMNIAGLGVKLVNESFRKPDLGGLLVGSAVSVAAFAAALEKHPKLLRARTRRSRTR